MTNTEVVMSTTFGNAVKAVATSDAIRAMRDQSSHRIEGLKDIIARAEFELAAEEKNYNAMTMAICEMERK